MANVWQYNDPDASHLAAIGYTQMEDGRFMAPDGESSIGAEEAASLTRGGLAADQLVDGSPVQRVANWAGGEDDQNVQRELAYLKSFGIEATNHPELGWIVPDDAKLHQAHPDQNSSSIFDFGPLIISALFTAGMASGFIGGGAAGAEAAGAVGAAGVGGEGFGATIPYSAGSTAGFSAAQQAAGLTAAQAAGAEVGATSFTAAQQAAALSAAGGGLIGGATGAAVGGETGGATTVSQLTEAQQTILETAQEWGNYTDPWATGDATSVANSGIAGDMSLAAPTTGDTIVKAATETPPTPSSAKQFLNADTQPPAPVETRTPAPPLSIWDRIWNGLTSDKGMAAAITGGLQVAGGVGAAMLNRETMQDRADLYLQNATALQQAKTDQSRANMYTGLIGVRPAATRRPLQRLTGGPVYDDRGLIRRA